MMHGSDWFMGGMWLFWLVILVGLVLLVRWVAVTGRTQPEPKKDSAEDILKQRYARGEIEREEYEQKMQDLGH